MGKKELVVNFLVWWIVATGLFFGIAGLIASAPGAQSVLEPGTLLAIIAMIVALAIFASEKWRDWLRE